METEATVVEAVPLPAVEEPASETVVDKVVAHIAPTEPRPKRAFAQRWIVSEPTPLDYWAIPALTSQAPTGDGSSFDLVRHDLTPRSCPPGDDARRLVVYSMAPVPPEKLVIRAADSALPVRALRGSYDDQDRFVEAFVETAQDESTPPDWTQIDEAHRTANELSLARFEGRTTAVRGNIAHFKATAKLAGQASAIVLGVVYAYRSCVLDCGSPPGSASRVEELGLIGPPSGWEGASNGVESRDFTIDEEFSEVRARVSRGSSATLSIVVGPEDLDRFAKDGKKHGIEGGAIVYSVEIVWPDGSVAPEARLFVGTFDGSASELTDATLRPPPSEKDAYEGQCVGSGGDE